MIRPIRLEFTVFVPGPSDPRAGTNERLEVVIDLPQIVALLGRRALRSRHEPVSSRDGFTTVRHLMPKPAPKPAKKTARKNRGA